MSSQLHITNGDILTNKLSTLKLEGDVITWREMLCEGKTETSVGSASIWKARFDFLNKNYKVSKSWFIDKTLKEYRTLCNHKQEDRIVLWFDFDLFDQINMLAVISWLKTHRPYAEISLVSSEAEENSVNITGLGELDNEQLRKFYTNRTLLTQDDIEYADYVWKLYCSDNPIRLENLKDFDSFQFSHLSGAIEAHLMRFPTIRNGLNEVENNILRLARNAKPKTKVELLDTVLRNQGRYGFGDTQYDRVMTKLKPLFTNFNPVKLSKKGMEILEGKTSYYACIQENDAYLGGALKYNFLYNSETNRILKL